MASELLVWVVYDSPGDAPGLWVVRPQTAELEPRALVFAWTFRALSAARRFCREMGLHCIPRYPEDDPVIVEVWI